MTFRVDVDWNSTGGLPINLLNSTLCALLSSSATPCVIGSLSLLEHLPSDLWRFLKTEDVDYALALDSHEQLLRVEEAMNRLGLRRNPGESGKWVSSTATVDLIGRTLPTGLAAPTCLPEPFANVIHLDMIRCEVIPRIISHPHSARVVAAGPLVTALGKSLKITRYLRLSDWSVDPHRRARAARAARDTVLVMVHNGERFKTDRSEDLAHSAIIAGREVMTTLERGMRAFVDLFGLERSVGWSLVRQTGWELDSTAKELLPVVRECALGVRHVQITEGR